MKYKLYKSLCLIFLVHWTNLYATDRIKIYKSQLPRT